MTKKEAAYLILKEHGKPLHVKEIIKIALDKGMITTSGKTPELSLTSDLHREIQYRPPKNKPARFYYISKGVWGLVEWKKKENSGKSKHK